MIAYLPIILVFILYFSSIPIAYALFGSSLFYFAVIDTSSPVDLILQKFVTSTQSFPLLAIPFFVMAGSIMNYAGISKKLMQFADVLTGHMAGGMAQVNVLLSYLWEVSPVQPMLMQRCRARCWSLKWKKRV